jgi:hypothetical protein
VWTGSALYFTNIRRDPLYMQLLIDWIRNHQGSLVAFGVLIAALIAAVSAVTVAIVNAIAASKRDRTNLRREYHRTILEPFLKRIDGDIVTASAVLDMLAGWTASSESSSGQQFDYREFIALTAQITSYDVASPVPRVPAMIENLKVRDRHLDECLYQVTIARIDFIHAAKRFAQENRGETPTPDSARQKSVTPETQKRLYQEARRFASACIALRHRVEKIMLR